MDRALELTRGLEKSTKPAFLDTLGWVHYVRGKYTEAVVALQQAVAGAPQIALLRAHLGLAQFKAGQRDEARGNLQIAAAAADDYPEAAEVRTVLARLKGAN